MRSVPDVLSDLQVPRAIEALARAVADRGGRAWLVGGGVRDHLMGRPVKDLDVEVHGLPQDALEATLRSLGKVDAVGRSFGVWKLRPRRDLRDPGLPDLDVSIPRRDSNAGPGHRGIAVEGDPWMPLDETVRRRDLTINAILVDVLTREIADPAGGRADLAAGRLRAVDPDTFLDDPLRALRVVQFVARTGFTPDDALCALCVRAPLDELPAERIQGEWGKLLLKGEHVARGMGIARRTDVLARVFPERVDDPALDDALDRARPHRDALDDEGRRWALMLSVWLARTADASVLPTLDRLWLHKVGGFNVREQVVGVLRHRDDPAGTDAHLRHLSVHAELQLSLGLRQALSDGTEWRERLERARELGILERPPPPVLQGRDLAGRVPPGPRMGVLLREAYAAQLDGTVTSREQALGLVLPDDP